MDGSLIHDLHRVDQLRQAAAAAAPAVSRLLAAGAAAGLSESESLSALGMHLTMARWCRSQLRILEQGDADQLALAAMLVADGVEEAVV